jgi:hypothetical protein
MDAERTTGNGPREYYREPSQAYGLDRFFNQA